MSQLVVPAPRSLRAAAGWPGRLGVIALLGGGAALLAWSGLPICPTAALFGVPCPGCGLTRATLALLHGDVHGAWHLHPLVFVLLPAVGAAALLGALEYVIGRRSPVSGRRSRLINAGAGLLLALLLGVWGLRFGGYFGGPVAVDSAFARFTR